MAQGKTRIAGLAESLGSRLKPVCQVVVICLLALAGASLAQANPQSIRRVTFPPVENPDVRDRLGSCLVIVGPGPRYDDNYDHALHQFNPEVKSRPKSRILLTKVRYDLTLEWTDAVGRFVRFEPWESFTRDCLDIAHEVTARLNNGEFYQYDIQNLAEPAGFDPKVTPMLYMTGDYDFVLTQQEIENIRKFINAGGTMFFNSARGGKEFNAAVVREMKRVVSDKRFMRAHPKHPIFSVVYDINTVLTVINGQQRPATPEVYTLDIGDRAGAIFVPFGTASALVDLSVASYERRGEHYAGESARRLIVNIVTYATGLKPNPANQL